MRDGLMQLGTLRKPDEGVWLGTMWPPRGVPKSDFAQLDYYGVWFPNLSPSAELVKEALVQRTSGHGPHSAESFGAR